MTHESFEQVGQELCEVRSERRTTDQLGERRQQVTGTLHQRTVVLRQLHRVTVVIFTVILTRRLTHNTVSSVLPSGEPASSPALSTSHRARPTLLFR